MLADAVRDPAELCRLVGLPELADEAAQAASGFPILVPRPFLERIRPGDAADPLLRQVLPRRAELVASECFTTDPLGEVAAGCSTGLLQKYRGRALLLTTGTCGVHCRFCFRRHYPFDSLNPIGSSGLGATGSASAYLTPTLAEPVPPSPALAPIPTLAEPVAPGDWDEALGLIADDASIAEVILSGGDPLTLPDCQLAQLAERLAAIPHVRRLRLHTRMPVVVPQRVTAELLDWLRATRLTPLVVIHVNHPAELDRVVAAALGRLADAGVPLLSQGVLLRGVNDDADVLAELYGRLADLRVMPYYLHQLDPVAGAADFEVPVARGRQLIAALRARLPGYAVPRYVRETRGGASKEALA